MVGESPHLSMYTRSFSYTGRKNLAHLHTTCAYVHTHTHTHTNTHTHTHTHHTLQVYVRMRPQRGWHPRHRRTDPAPPTLSMSPITEHHAKKTPCRTNSDPSSASAQPSAGKCLQDMSQGMAAQRQTNEKNLKTMPVNFKKKKALRRKPETQRERKKKKRRPIIKALHSIHVANGY